MGLHQRVPFERVIRQGDALRGGLGRVQRGIGLLDQGSGAQSATLGRVGDPTAQWRGGPSSARRSNVAARRAKC